MIPPRVTYSRPLFEGFTTSEITSERIAELRDLPLVIHAGLPGLPVVASEKGPQRVVRTINDFYQAQEDGLYAKTNADMRIWGHFQLVADLLSAAFIARPSQTTHLTSISDTSLLPARYVSVDANWINPDAEKVAEPPLNVTIANYVTIGKCKVVHSEPQQLEVQNGVISTLTEVMRGDLDGDGTEDMLVWRWSQLMQGSMHWSSSIALTRHNETGVFTKTRLPFQ